MKKTKIKRMDVKRKLNIFLIEILLISWILICLYLWLVLEFVSNPGLIIIRPNMPQQAAGILEKSRERIWPYVWKDYIYSQK